MTAPMPDEVNELARRLLDAAFAVHRELGPGFLESIDARAMRLELDARGIPFECEKPVSVLYRGVPIPGQRLDLIVGGQVDCSSTSTSGCWRTASGGSCDEATTEASAGDSDANVRRVHPP